MDVYLLYFTLHNTDPNGLTTWGSIVIEDDEMESFVGSGSSELESLLDGLTKCLAQIPSTLPIVIRSRNRTVLQLGKRWLNTWRSDGWDTEEHSELISELMEVLETRTLEWFNPNYLDHLDKTVIEYAVEEWNFQQEDLEDDPDELSEDSSEHDASEVDAVEDDLSASTTDTDSTPMDNRIGPESITEDCHLTINVNQEQSIDLEKSKPLNHTLRPPGEHETVIDPAESITKTLDSDSNETNKSIENVSQTVETKPILNTIIPSEPSDIEVSNTEHQPQESFRTPGNFRIDPNDQSRYPYVDDDGWHQLHTLFHPPFQEAEQHHPNRIVAYVTANHHHDLAAWSFALIDKPSRMAFFKAVGHRHSTQNRALLQGCISLLSSIKSTSHRVECRVQNTNLAQLIERLIEDPYAAIEDDIWTMESAFVSQLSYWLEQRTVTVRTISEGETVLASQMVHHFSQQRLNALNSGDSAEFSQRRTRFPLERLLN
jgi:ribonuclease HI